MTVLMADVYGTRAPPANGTVWPPRVVRYLEPGTSEDSVESWVQSACLLCSNGWTDPQRKNADWN